MDLRQLILAARAKMRAATWPQGAGEVVLGNRVFACADGIEEEQIPLPPFALIHPGEYTTDPKRSSLINAQMSVVVVIDVQGDPLGENAVLGGPRSGDVLGSSKGRGILELSQALLAPVREVTGADGLPLIVNLGSGTRARPIGDNRHLVAQQHVIRCFCTTLPEWLPVPWFTATKNGNDVDLAWKLPPDAAGLLQGVRIRFAAGSTPPADVTEGAEAYSGTGTSHTHTPGAFPVSYSIFAAYSETGATADHAHSINEPWTQRTVAA